MKQQIAPITLASVRPGWGSATPIRFVQGVSMVFSQTLTEMTKLHKAKVKIDHLACGPHHAFDQVWRPVRYLDSTGHL